MAGRRAARGVLPAARRRPGPLPDAPPGRAPRPVDHRPVVRPGRPAPAGARPGRRHGRSGPAGGRPAGAGPQPCRPPTRLPAAPVPPALVAGTGLARAGRRRVDGARGPRTQLLLVRGTALLHRPAHPADRRGTRPGRRADGVRRRRAAPARRARRPEPAAGAPGRRRHRHRRVPAHPQAGRPAALPHRRPAAHPARPRRLRAPCGHPRRTPAAVHGDPRHPRTGPVQPAHAPPGGGAGVGVRTGQGARPRPVRRVRRRAQPRRGPALRARPGPRGPRPRRPRRRAARPGRT